MLNFKAALLLGMQFRAVPVSRSDDYSLRGHALREVMERDVKEGLIPFFVSECPIYRLTDRLNDSLVQSQPSVQPLQGRSITSQRSGKSVSERRPTAENSSS
jgi:hypothetical protein